MKRVIVALMLAVFLVACAPPQEAPAPAAPEPATPEPETEPAPEAAEIPAVEEVEIPDVEEDLDLTEFESLEADIQEVEGIEIE